MQTRMKRINFVVALAFSVSVPAQAAIVMNPHGGPEGNDSFVMMSVTASSGGNADEQRVELRPFDGSYSNTLSAASNTIFCLDLWCETTHISHAEAAASVSASADADTGIFQVSGSYAGSWEPDFNGGILAYVDTYITFSTDTPYHYSLDSLTSAGTSGGVGLARLTPNEFTDVWQPPSGLPTQMTGYLPVGEYALWGNISGCSAGCFGTVPGNFQYSLVLTPVPEPATWAFMLAGLWLVGVKAGWRRQTEI